MDIINFMQKTGGKNEKDNDDYRVAFDRFAVRSDATSE